MTKKEKNKKKEELIEENKKYLEGWKRAKADLINFKAGEETRFRESVKRNKKEFIMGLLPVIDNFDLAESMISEDEKKNESIKGLLKIKDQLNKFLFDQGVEVISSKGEEFNPNIHEAMEMVENEDFKSGIVVEVVQKGYLMDGEILRPARVKVVK